MSVATISLENGVVNAVFNAFNALPSKSKPMQTNGVQSWIPLSGIVLSYRDSVDLECVSLG